MKRSQKMKVNRKKTKGTNDKKNKRRVTRRNYKQMGGNSEDTVLLMKQINIFRGKFREHMLPFMNSSGLSNKKIKELINKMKQLFEDNYEFINVGIPINNERLPVLNNTYDYVPIPTVFMDHISNINVLKTLLLAFYKTGGNINATSRMRSQRESVFTRAVRTNQLDIVNLLLEEPFYLTRDNLPESEKENFDRLLNLPAPSPRVLVPTPTPSPSPKTPSPIPKTPSPRVLSPTSNNDIEPINEVLQIPPINKGIDKVPVISKLMVPFPLPNVREGYDHSKSPDFWKPIFDDTGVDLLELRTAVINWVSEDSVQNVYDRYTSDRTKNSWSTCSQIESMFSGYSTRTTPINGMSGPDFVNMNTALCIILILFGILSYRMDGQDYDFIFKGGKAVQFVLSEIPNSKYISDDIDILVIPTDSIGYNKSNVENLSTHIGLLIQWFLKDMLNISIEVPNSNEKTIGKEIVKLAIINSTNRYVALSDIGFDKIKDNVKEYFTHPQEFRMFSPQLQQPMLFRCPTIESILKEKLYYLLKFIELKNLLNKGMSIPYPEYENVTNDNLDYFISKFKRSIKSLIDGLIIKSFGTPKQSDWNSHEMLMINELLLDFEVNNEYKEEAAYIIIDTNMY
jgi:hypothetical protein